MYALLRGVVKKADLQKGIDSAVGVLSRIVHQRSFLVLLHLRRLMTAGSTLPDLTDANATFFRHCFTVGLGTTVDAELSETMRCFPSIFVQLPKLPKGLNNAVSHAAKLYKTNFLNHFTLVAGMEGRIKKFASQQLHGLEVRIPAAQGPSDPDAEEEAKAEDIAGVNRKGGGLDAVCRAVFEATDPSKDAADITQHHVDLVTKIRTMIGVPDGTKLTEAGSRATCHWSSSSSSACATISTMFATRPML